MRQNSRCILPRTIQRIGGMGRGICPFARGKTPNRQHHRRHDDPRHAGHARQGHVAETCIAVSTNRPTKLQMGRVSANSDQRFAWV